MAKKKEPVYKDSHAIWLEEYIKFELEKVNEGKFRAYLKTLSPEDYLKSLRVWAHETRDSLEMNLKAENTSVEIYTELKFELERFNEIVEYLGSFKENVFKSRLQHLVERILIFNELVAGKGSMKIDQLGSTRKKAIALAKVLDSDRHSVEGAFRNIEKNWRTESRKDQIARIKIEIEEIKNSKE